MQDLVRIIQTYSELQGYFFSYGSEAHLELLNSDLDEDKIYVLLFPINRRTIQSTTGTKVQGRRYNGRLMLVKGGDFSEHYFNENESDEAESKYTTTIEPLIPLGESLVEYLMCEGLEVENWENDDVINTLDSNKDGLWYRFTLVQRL